MSKLSKAGGSGDLIRTITPSEASETRDRRAIRKVQRLADKPWCAADAFATQPPDRCRAAILPTLRVPTLVLHGEADLQVPVELGRKLAAAIPGVKYIKYPASAHAFSVGDNEGMLGDIEGFRHRPSRPQHQAS